MGPPFDSQLPAAAPVPAGRPAISVLLPCFNAVATLDEAMGSIIHQTLADVEIIAVDDGSTDGTLAALRRWERQDSRVTVVTTPRRGIVEALNTAASHARADLLARMDADDVSHPERLECQCRFMESEPAVGACGSQIRYFPAEEVLGGASRYESWINSLIDPGQLERDLFVECPIPHPTLVVRTSVFHAVGGYRDRGWPEDYDFLLRLWSSGHAMAKIPRVLLHWRESAGRLSRTHPRYSEDAFRRCKAHFIGHRLAGRVPVVWGAGPVGKSFARALQKCGHSVAAFVEVDPAKIGKTIGGVPVIERSALVRNPQTYVLAAVGSASARAEIREFLRSTGFREPEDCCAVA